MKEEGILVPYNPYADMVKVKNSATFQLFKDYMGLSEENLDPEGLERLINKFGNSTTWVYIAVKRISDALSQIPFSMRRAGQADNERPGPRRPQDRGIMEFMLNPNPWQRWFDFCEALITSLELTGNAFIEIVKDNSGRPVEMYILNAARVTIIPDPRAYIAGYIFTVNGKHITFKADDVLHIKYHHPSNDYYGLSPLTAARVAIDVDKAANEWNQTFLLRGAWPAGAIETEQDLAPEDLKRLQRQIKQTMQTGKDQAGRMLLLTGGLKYNALAITPKEADWMDARRMSRDEILSIFGVPYAVAGLFSTEQTTARSAGVEQQIKQFYRTTIFSKVDKILSAFNRQLIPMFRAGVELTPNYRHIPALQEEVDQELVRAMAFKTLVNGGVSVNKALARLYPDMEPEPWGEVSWMNKNLIPISGPEVPDAPSDTPNDNRDNTRPDAQSDSSSASKSINVKEITNLFDLMTDEMKSDHLLSTELVERILKK